MRAQLAFKTVGTIKSRTALKTRVSAEVDGTGVGEEKGGAARLTSCKTEGRWELCGDLGTGKVVGQRTAESHPEI